MAKSFRNPRSNTKYNKRNVSPAFIRGTQIIFHNMRMLIQVNKKIFGYLFLCALMSVLLLAWFFTPSLEIHAALAYIKANWYHIFAKNDSHLITVKTVQGSYDFTAGSILKNSYFSNTPIAIWGNLLTAIYITVGASVASLIAAIWFFKRKGEEFVNDEHVRGASFADNKTVVKMLKTEKEASPNIHLAGVPIIDGTEVQHFGLHGTTGTGKTVTIMEMLDQIRHPKKQSNHDQRAIIFDDSGAFVKKYYNPERGDVILNPFDERCANWDLWSECQNMPDFENFAASLIPDDGDKDQFWIKSARNWVANIAYKLGQRNEASIENLLRAAFNLDLERLKKLLENTPAEQLVDKSIAKTAMTIRAVITNFLRSLRYMQGIDQSKPKFSLRQWILDEKKHHGAWVFITSVEKHHEVIKPLISLWLSMATSFVKSLSRDFDRRIWVFLDEVPRLQRLLSLMDTLAVGRNYGLCCVLGMQNSAQMRSIYGKDQATAIMDLLSTQLYYRSTLAEIADEASWQLGEADIKESTESYSYGYEATRDGIQTSRQNVTKRVISYSEIQGLNKREAFLKLPGDYPRTKLRFDLVERNVLAPDFIERKIRLDGELEGLVKTADHEVSHDHSIEDDLLNNILGDKKHHKNSATTTSQEDASPPDDSKSDEELSPEIAIDQSANGGKKQSTSTTKNNLDINQSRQR